MIPDLVIILLCMISGILSLIFAIISQDCFQADESKFLKLMLTICLVIFTLSSMILIHYSNQDYAYNEIIDTRVYKIKDKCYIDLNDNIVNINEYFGRNFENVDSIKLQVEDVNAYSGGWIKSIKDSGPKLKLVEDLNE